jgi:hypothetical protein
MKLSEFVASIDAIMEKPHQWNNLEEFLRGMWGAALNNRDVKPTWELFVQIISDAWTNQPLHFDETWLEIKESADDIETKTEINLGDFDYLRGTILYQIADLRRMRIEGYFERDSVTLFWGVQSPTGASWYNWSPESFLECGTRGMIGHQGKDYSLVGCTWRDLAELLYLGQIYE